MHEKILSMERRMLSTLKGLKRWQKIVTTLSCLVVFVTTYALILPVITMSVEPQCGLEEHTHTDDCYSLTCTVEEGSAHVHSPECYEEHTIYICTPHEHDENCEPDCPDHVHTDECTETEQKLICPLSTEPHVHTVACYGLVCGMEEHTHTEECFGQTEVVEAVAEDEAYLAKLPELKGVWAEDFFKAAKSQVGYLCTDGYNMYAAGYDDAPEQWDAAFAAWCMDAAGVSDSVKFGFPRQTDALQWLLDLKVKNLLHSDEWTPVPGDLVFFTTAEDAERVRVGILSDTKLDEEENLAALTLIVGDWEGKVAEQELPLEAIELLGWTRLPEKPELFTTENAEEAENADDGIALYAVSDLSNPLELADPNNKKSGEITRRKIEWRLPDGEWKEYNVQDTVPANAEFRVTVYFIGVDSKELKNHNYALEYKAESILTNFNASGLIVTEDGDILGRITASNTADANIAMLDFSQGSAWVDANELVKSSFTYQGQLDLSQLGKPGSDGITLGGIKIDIPNAEDAVAEFASVELNKQSTGLKNDGNGNYYIEYTLTVTAGEYGSPDVRLLDKVTNKPGKDYLDGYIGVTGTAQIADGVDGKPLDDGSPKGTVYMTSTTPAQLKDNANPVPQPVPDDNGTYMAWVIGDMGPNESRTLTYRVAVKDSYVGLAHRDDPITNTADLFSKKYERGTKTKTFSPTATAGISKAKVGEPRIVKDEVTGKDKYVIDYVVTVTADRNNAYPMTDLKIYDYINQWEGTEYRSAIKLVDGTVKLYEGNAVNAEKELNLSDYTTYTDAQGREQTRANPRNNNNGTFDVFVGDVAPGDSRTVTYTLEMDIQAAQQGGNGAIGIFNRSYVFSDEVRQNQELNYSTTRDVQSYNQWVSKTTGNQTQSSQTVVFPDGAEIYDATQNTPAGTTLPTVTDAEGYTIPAGAYSYTVKINQSGEWDVTAATWKDTIQGSDTAGNRYMQFLEYVRVDVYDKLVDGTTGEAIVSPDLKKSIWVKIDDQWEFAFSGKQIGLDGSDAYVLTYYTEAILPPGVSSYGTINADNRFGISGTVGKGGITINPNIYQAVTVTAKEPGVNDPYKAAWYYDANDHDFDKYHGGEGKGNGAQYWIIKISGDKIPMNMQFQESTRLENWNTYLRNNESLLGFYLISFPDGTQNASNVNEFLDRYETYDDFLADFNSPDSNIEFVPTTFNGQPLYTQRWNGYTDNRHGSNGQHFDLTLQFKQDYTIPPGKAMYLLIKTDPVQMPGNGQSVTYYNKCNFRTDAMGNIVNWPFTRASQTIVGPDGSLNKQPGGVYVVENAKTDGTWNEYFNSAKFSSITKTGKTDAYSNGQFILNRNDSDRKNRDLQNSILAVGHSIDDVRAVYNKHNNSSGENVGGGEAVSAGTGYRVYNDQYLNYAYENGTYVTWTVQVNKAHTMSGPYIIEDTLPDGVELAYVRLYQVSNGYSASKPVGNVAKRATGTYDFGEGWTPWTVVSNRYQQQYWMDSMVDYYTNGNTIKMYLPNVEKANDATFQIVARVTDSKMQEATLGDFFLNNQATLYDTYGNKVESSGAEVRVRGGSVNKQLLMDGKYNSTDPSKLNSTVFPYRLDINAERADMNPDGNTIQLPLVDRMTGNMALELDTLRIYALPEGVDTVDEGPGGDQYLLYYGGSYTDNEKAAGHFWYIGADGDRTKLGQPVGYLGPQGTQPIGISTRPAVDEYGHPIMGSDGSQMVEALFENLPDETHLVISYSVSVKLKDGTKLIFDNNAFWEGHEENQGGDTDAVVKEYQAEAIASGDKHGNVHIVKYDASSYESRLKGAEFALIRAEYKEASQGYALVGGTSPETATEVDTAANHITAVYQGNDFSVNSQDPEVRVRWTQDMTSIVEIQVILPDGQRVWKLLGEATTLFDFHHKFDTTADGKLKVCGQGPLGYGETDENGNLSYGFGEDKNFGKRFTYDAQGNKVYQHYTEYQEDRIYFNKVYAVYETKAPDGYEIDSNPYFFVVPNADYYGGVNYFYHDQWPEEVHICSLTEYGELTYMHNAPNVKDTLKITKDFSGSKEAFRPGTYTFGIFENQLTAVTREGLLGTASITYTESDFGWTVVQNGITYLLTQQPNGQWKGTSEDGTKVITSRELPQGAAYGLLPGHVRTAEFPKTLNYSPENQSYYIYEMNASGLPVLGTGMISGYQYTPEFSGSSISGGNQVVFDSQHSQIDARNVGYSVTLEKMFNNINGSPMESGLIGSYKFGIWPQGEIGSDGLPTTPATEANTKTITWAKGDTQASKSVTFMGLNGSKVYYIFELDKDDKPIQHGGIVNTGGGSFTVGYSETSVRPADGTSTTVTAVNTPFYVALPHTGGMGTNLFTYGGFALMSLACLGYMLCWMQRRKGKGDRS